MKKDGESREKKRVVNLQKLKFSMIKKNGSNEREHGIFLTFFKNS